MNSVVGFLSVVMNTIMFFDCRCEGTR